MKKEMMATMTLMNQSLNENEEYKVMTVKKELLDDSIAENGGEDMKELLSERIDDFFNNDIKDYFDNLTDDEIENCINELAIGHASNIKGEDFWWEEQECVMFISK